MKIKTILSVTVMALFVATSVAIAGGSHHVPLAYKERGLKKEGLIEVGNKICPVTNESVDAMGEPYQVKYKGKIYNLCCKMCSKDFKKNKTKYIQMIEKEMENDHSEKDDHSESHYNKSKHNHSSHDH